MPSASSPSPDCPTSAQQDERWQALEAQIDRIYAQNEYSLPRFGAGAMARGRHGVHDGRAGHRPGRRQRHRPLRRGDRRAQHPDRQHPVDSRRIRNARCPIDDYVWSDDGSKLLIFTNTQKVWRQNTRGDYWVLTACQGRRRSKQVGTSHPPASLMFAKFSPDATRVGYVRGNNVYVERLDDGKVTQLTTDGSETIINGTSDWVYEEEFGAARRLPLQSRRKVGRLLPVRQHRRRHLLADQQHRFALSDDHEDSVSEGRHDQFRGAHRRGERRGRPDDVDQDGGRSAQHLSRAHRVDRCEHGLDPAAQSPAESQRLPDRRHQERRGQARVPRRVDVVGRGRRGGAVDRWRPHLPVAERARRLPARLSRAARRRHRPVDHEVRRRRHRHRRLRREGGLHVFPRLAGQRRPALSVSIEARWQRRARARHAGGSAGHASLRRVAERQAGVPHLLAVRDSRR